MDKLKIMIVDDEKQVLQRFAELLYEYDVTLESSPLRAIEKIRETDFDIIFADYKMPTVNGIEFLEVVKDDYKNKRYVSILCTAYGTTYLFESDRKEGIFQFFLEKPFTKESLEKVVVAIKHTCNMVK